MDQIDFLGKPSRAKCFWHSDLSLPNGSHIVAETVCHIVRWRCCYTGMGVIDELVTFSECSCRSPSASEITAGCPLILTCFWEQSQFFAKRWSLQFLQDEFLIFVSKRRSFGAAKRDLETLFSAVSWGFKLDFDSSYPTLTPVGLETQSGQASWSLFLQELIPKQIELQMSEIRSDGGWIIIGNLALFFTESCKCYVKRGISEAVERMRRVQCTNVR